MNYTQMKGYGRVSMLVVLVLMGGWGWIDGRSRLWEVFSKEVPQERRVSGQELGGRTMPEAGRQSATAATLTVGLGQTYTTIQAAIDAASPGDTIEVLVGTYSENIVILKPLTLRGARAGVKATGSNRPGGESIINGTGDSSSFVVRIEADQVTLDGFKIEIRNNARDGINCRIGNVVSPATKAIRSNLTLQNNWLFANLPTRTSQVNGILLGEHISNSAQAFSAEISNVLIKDNYVDLTTSASAASPTATSIVGARGLVFTNMFRNSGASLDYTGLVVDSNVIFSTYQTILQAQLQTRLVGAIFNNNIIGNSRSGPNLPTLINSSVFSNNTIQNINPGTDYYSNLAGAYLGVVNSTVSNNIFSGIQGSACLVLAGGRSADLTYFPASSNSTISGNTFTYNSASVSTLAAYNSGILLESNTSATPTNVNNWESRRQLGTTGVVADSITLSNNTFTNGVFSSSLRSVAISQESVGTILNAVNATPNIFNGVALGGGTTTSQLVSIADAVADVVDSPGLGGVTLKSGTVVVTINSFWNPTSWTASPTTTASIARGISLASPGNTVQVGPGDFTGSGNNMLGVSKALTIQGANFASPAANGTGSLPTRGPETVLTSSGLLFQLSAANVTIAGFKFTNLGGRSIDSIVGPLDNLKLENNWFICPTNQPTNSTMVIQLSPGGSSMTNMLLKGNRFESSITDNSNPWIGLGATTSANGFSLQNNDFVQNGNFRMGGVFQYNAPALSGMLVTGNWFGGAYGLNMNSLVNPTVTGNTFVPTSYGMLLGLATGQSGGTVGNNVFHGTSAVGNGIGLWLYGNSDGVSVANNTFANWTNGSVQAGIYVGNPWEFSGAPNVMVSGNSFDTSTSGIHFLANIPNAHAGFAITSNTFAASVGT
jgi:hypothetical protein